jgi:hypothetical protein
MSWEREIGNDDMREFARANAATRAPKIGVEPCSCGHRSCTDFWLTGVGKFVQGSGFTKEEAERIAALLNWANGDA